MFMLVKIRGKFTYNTFEWQLLWIETLYHEMEFSASFHWQYLNLWCKALPLNIKTNVLYDKNFIFRFNSLVWLL